MVGKEKLALTFSNHLKIDRQKIQTKPKQSFRSYVQLNQFKMWCQICKDVSLSKEVSGETN